MTHCSVMQAAGVRTPALAVLTLVLLSFLWTWNDYVLVLVSDPAHQPITFGLGAFSGRYLVQINLLSVAAILVSLPAIVLSFVSQRQFIWGILSGSVKGQGATAQCPSSGRTRAMAVSPVRQKPSRTSPVSTRSSRPPRRSSGIWPQQLAPPVNSRTNSPGFAEKGFSRWHGSRSTT